MRKKSWNTWERLIKLQIKEMKALGEAVEMIMEGVLCQVCGCVMEDLIPETGEVLLEAPGYPRTCDDCK